MRKAMAFAVAFCFAASQLGWSVPVSRSPSAANPPQQEEQQPFEPYTAEQLDNLLAPIALYPDPLLAQVLVAATFVDQIDVAARWVRAFGQSGIENEPWDVSVKAVAHYPTVLSMMADNLDWTTALGQAYAYQSTDVMMSVQRLRRMASAQGNLVTTPQQQVIVGPQFIQIVPIGPEYIYVPYYDPAVIFFRRAYFPGYFTGVITFGNGWLIGAWLNLDFNWPLYNIYYTGWMGGGWIARCRPHIRLHSYYINNRFRTIVLNRKVTHRPLNIHGLSRYRSIHPRAGYENRLRGPVPRNPAVGTTNKIINRNINIYDPNLNRFRGRTPPSQPAARPRPPSRPAQPATRPGQPSTRPTQPATRPGQPSKAPATGTPVRPTPAQRPRTAPTPRQPATRQPGAFGGGNSVFSPKAASQRGRASRSQPARPKASRPAQQHQPRQQRRQP